MSEEIKDIKIPIATYVAYWPSKPEYVCERHKDIIKNIAYHMGLPLKVNAIIGDPQYPCTNCYNEQLEIQKKLFTEKP
jgi:hypothetical protein